MASIEGDQVLGAALHRGKQDRHIGFVSYKAKRLLDKFARRILDDPWASLTNQLTISGKRNGNFTSEIPFRFGYHLL